MQLRTMLWRALLSGVVALGAVVPAQGAYYVPELDPNYGLPYPSLGWRAVGQLYVPDACEAAIGLGGFVLSPFAVQPDPSCALAQLSSVTVEFYDIGNPLVTIETLALGSFAWAALPATTEDDVTQELLEIAYLGGNAVGLKTSLSTPLQATNALVNPPANYFSLNFSSANGRLVEFGSAAATTFSENLSVTSNLGQFSITRIPEPGTLALVLAACGGVGLARLRRRH